MAIVEGNIEIAEQGDAEGTLWAKKNSDFLHALAKFMQGKIDCGEFGTAQFKFMKQDSTGKFGLFEKVGSIWSPVNIFGPMITDEFVSTVPMGGLQIVGDDGYRYNIARTSPAGSGIEAVLGNYASKTYVVSNTEGVFHAYETQTAHVDTINESSSEYTANKISNTVTPTSNLMQYGGADWMGGKLYLKTSPTTEDILVRSWATSSTGKLLHETIDEERWNSTDETLWLTQHGAEAVSFVAGQSWISLPTSIPLPVFISTGAVTFHWEFKKVFNGVGTSIAPKMDWATEDLIVERVATREWTESVAFTTDEEVLSTTRIAFPTATDVTTNCVNFSFLNNNGDSNYFGLRRIALFKDGVRITNALKIKASAVQSYPSTVVGNLINYTLSLVGQDGNTSYVTSTISKIGIAIADVNDAPLVFDEVQISNYHYNGLYQARGAKDFTIRKSNTYSSDYIEVGEQSENIVWSGVAIPHIVDNVPYWSSYAPTGGDTTINNIPILTPDVGDFKMSIRTEDFSGWKLCNGRLLTTRETGLIEEAGITNIWSQSYAVRLPDADGMTIAGAGSTRAVGDRTGSESHTLTDAEMPRHNHMVRVQNGSNVGDVEGWVGHQNSDFLFGATDRNADYGVHYRINAPTSTNPAMAYSGGSEPHNNFQPTLFAGNLFVYIGE